MSKESVVIDERFSAAAFRNAGFGSPEARYLSKQLQLEIQNDLDVVIEPAILEVINKLKALGHNLDVVGELLPGDKEFQEPSENQDQRYKFLVALDIVISVGYPETVDSLPSE